MSHPITPSMIRRFTAIIAKTRSGKTYTIKGAIEEGLDAGDQVVVLDPTSAYYGLRLEGDGKTPAYPDLLIIGGEYGDIPLVPTAEAATALADVVFDQGISCIIDVGQLVGELVEWSTAFATQLYRRSNKTQPITFVIDEAHEFAPKDAKPGNSKNGKATAGDMAVAFRRIATGGGSRGIRLVALTQRVSKLHNDVLSSCETIVAMRTIWPNDRKVIAEVFAGSDDKEKAKVVLGSLANLKPGEGWVWDTNAGTLERVVFPKIKTFDSSATPTGKGVQRVSLKKIDREKIGKLLADAAEKIRENDPDEMKRRIEELEEQLEAKPASAAELAARPDMGEMAEQFRLGHESGVEDGKKHGRREAVDEYASAGAEILHDVRGIPGRLRDLISEVGMLEAKIVEKIPTVAAGEVDQVARVARPRTDGEGVPWGPIAIKDPPPLERRNGLVEHRTSKPVRAIVQVGDGEKAEIAPRQCRMLSAAAYLTDKLRRPPTRAQIGVLQGLRFYTGTFGDDLSKLKTAGMLVYPQDGAVEPTAAGRKLAAATVAGDWNLRVGIVKLLEPRQVRMLDVIVKHRGGISRENIGLALGVKHTTGTFGDDLSRVKRFGLIDYPTKGTARLEDWVRVLS